jgi:hypothetical protein
MIASFYIVRPEAFEAAEVGKIFSGYQTCEMVKTRPFSFYLQPTDMVQRTRRFFIPNPSKFITDLPPIHAMVYKYSLAIDSVAQQTTQRHHFEIILPAMPQRKP